MTTNLLAFSDAIARGLGCSPRVAAIWSCAEKNRSIVVIAGGAVATAVGYACGGPGLAAMALAVSCIFVGTLLLAKAYRDWEIKEFVQKLDAARNCAVLPSDLRPKSCFGESMPSGDMDPHIFYDTRFGEVYQLEVLNLAGLNLTDEHLRQMAASDRFHEVKTLTLANNPCITGRGIRFLMEKGFPSLEWLSLHGNTQLFQDSENLDEWLSHTGFHNLKTLDLTATDVTDTQLEKMIERAEWFRNLEGLNLLGNDRLSHLPHNILRLEKLANHGTRIHLDGGHSRFSGKGIWKTFNFLNTNPEELILVIASKIFTNISDLYALKSQACRIGFRKLCLENSLSDPIDSEALKNACERYNISFELSGRAAPDPYCSRLEVLDFSRATAPIIVDYRKRVATENLELSARSFSLADHTLKTGESLLQQSEFFNLQPYAQTPPNSSLRSIEYITRLIISLWEWALNKIQLWWNPASARILVLAKDTLDSAEEQVEQGGKVLVLSLASTEEPGGGFNEGIGSQEEELCWRSDLAGLMYVLKTKEQLANPGIWNLYHQAIHTPEVTVFRSSKTRSYSFLNRPFQVGILSCGPLVRPPLKGLGTNSVEYAQKTDKDQTRTLIYNQLHIAHSKGYNTLILGAFGCGAFRNPPAVVAQLYREVIDASFKKTFRKIVFAILDDPYRQPHNPEGNFKPFKNCFS